MKFLIVILASVMIAACGPGSRGNGGDELLFGTFACSYASTAT